MTTHRTSAGAYGAWLTRNRERRRKGAYTTAGILGVTSAFTAQAGQTGPLLAAPLAVAAAAAAWRAHLLNRPAPAEIRQRMGDEGEQATRTLLLHLTREGWHLFHDRQAPHGGNIDHLAVSPCGTAVAVIDSKRWRANAQVAPGLGGKALMCGQDNRTKAAHDVLNLNELVLRALGGPGTGVRVVPLLAIHGASVEGQQFHLWTQPCPVAVTGPEMLLPSLRFLAGRKDRAKADQLAARVQLLFPVCSLKETGRTR